MRLRQDFPNENVVRLIALLIGALGVLNICQATLPGPRLHLLQNYLPLQVTHGSNLAAVLAGLALLLISTSLWRGKRVGWILTTAVLLISIPAHVMKGSGYGQAASCAILAILLIYVRSRFPARSDAPSIRRGIQIFFAALSLTLVYGVVGFYLLDHHFRIPFELWSAFGQTLVMYTQFYDPGLQSISGLGRFLADSIYAIGAATMGFTLLMMLRPVVIRRPASEEERARAWAIVLAYGRTPLARYTLFDDKLYFFGTGGSMIAYVLKGRTAITLGDPIGPRTDFARCLVEFKEFCAASDWIPVFYQVLPDHLSAYQAAGFDAFCIGHDAIVDLSTFTLSGRESKNIRNSLQKMTRLGYTIQLCDPPHSRSLLIELNEISKEWISNRGGFEMGFSLGWLDEDYLNACPIILVRNPEGRAEAFANIVFEFLANEAITDLMRYRPDSRNGLMDYLFVSLLQWAKERGLATFNLGFSPFTGIGKEPHSPAVERALRHIHEHTSRFLNFKGLHFFKEKFNPIWSPRYLIYPGMASLPSVATGVMRAYGVNQLIGRALFHPKFARVETAFLEM